MQPALGRGCESPGIDSVQQAAVWRNHRDLSTPAADTTMDQRDAPAAARIGQYEPCRDIVQSVQRQITSLKETKAVVLCDKFGNGDDLYGGIDGSSPLSGNIRFFSSYHGFRAEELTVEVGAIEDITVRRYDFADPNAEHMLQKMAAQSSQAGNQYGFRGQLCLIVLREGTDIPNILFFHRLMPPLLPKEEKTFSVPFEVIRELSGELFSSL